MPWYKSGTVSVVQNSNAVIGTGTSFIANSRVGDAFRGPDGGWYEVTNIASDSALSVSPNYQGDTASAGAYALAPMQGYVKQSADALRSLVNQFGSVLAVLGTDGTLDGVRSSLNLADTDGLPEGDNKYFTDARVRAAILTGMVTNDPSAVAETDSVVAAFGKLQAQSSGAATAIGEKAAKGANNDITELNALTKAVTVAQGGTGVTSMAALLTALNGIGNYSKGNILGTVAQASGVPTGAIIERGSNANGEYVKFADGTLVCWRAISEVSGYPVAVGAVQASNAYLFPATFVAAVVRSYQGYPTDAAGNNLSLPINDYSPATSVAGWQISVRNNSSIAVNRIVQLQFIAIGRWF